MNCILCDKPMAPRFSHSGFNLFWCSSCEFGRLEGDFTPEQVAGFYPTDYYTHGTTAPLTSRASIVERTLVHLAWRTDGGLAFDPSETSGKSVCDLGCGNGGNLRKFKAAGYKTVGVEPDERALAAAQDAGVIVPGTAEDLPIKGSFDVVLMSHVLEHCIDPVRAASNAASLLAEGGTLIIEVPNNAALGFNWFEGRWPWTDIPRHLSFFSEASLRVLFSKLGLQVTRTFYVGYTRQFAPVWRDKIDSPRSGWPLLAATSLATDAKKYDSVRVHVRY